MNPSLINAWSSMTALQTKIDTISNNIANVDTVGFKSRNVSFQDVLTNRIGQAQGMELPGRLTPLGLTQGMGSRIGASALNLAQGSRKETGNPLDLMIEGDGFFEVTIPDANGGFTRALTRDGSFQVSYENGTGYLTTKRGEYVMSSDGSRIEVPAGSKITIDSLGRIYATPEGDASGAAEQIGSLRISRVTRPQELVNLGDNLYGINVPNIDEIIQPIDMEDDDARSGLTVASGALEASNVDMVQEMTELMIAQRAYQMSARAIQSTDTMMGLVNNLRG